MEDKYVIMLQYLDSDRNMLDISDAILAPPNTHTNMRKSMSALWISSAFGHHAGKRETHIYVSMCPE